MIFKRKNQVSLAKASKSKRLFCLYNTTYINKGKKGLIGLFMGEVMKLSKGQADPKLANQLLRTQLEK